MSRSGSSLGCFTRTAFVVAALLSSASCRAGVKGGSLEGINPYGSWEKIDVVRVKAAQRKSNQLREVRCDAHPGLQYVTGFARVRTEGTREPLSPFLVVWTGAKRSKIPLSQIAAISVKAVDPAGRRVQWEITIFPTVSPASLVKLKPNYVTLAANYTKTMTAWISDGGAKPGRMAIVGRSARDEMAPEIRVAFADIPVGANLRFHGLDITCTTNYWWAISSVSQDPKDPYRWQPTGE